MGYTPENNPYIPGDPYSYDLAWMVEEVKKAQQVGENAQASADAALQSQIEAQQAKDLSMAWAIGEDDGGPIPPGEPQYENNSKYYAEQAADNAQSASDDAADAHADMLSAKNYADNIADPVSGLVTTWLADNITQPTTPAIDASLSVAGAAADAKATGDEIGARDLALYATQHYTKADLINTGYIANNGIIGPNASAAHTDLIKIPAGAVSITVLCHGAYTFPSIAFYSADLFSADCFISGTPTPNNEGYMDNPVTALIPSGAVYFALASRIDTATIYDFDAQINFDAFEIGKMLRDSSSSLLGNGSLITNADLTNSSKFITSNGILNANTAFATSALIPITYPLDELVIEQSGAIPTGCAVAFYYFNEFTATSFIKGTALASAVSIASPVKVAVPDGARYMAFSGRTTSDFRILVKGKTMTQYLDPKPHEGEYLSILGDSISSFDGYIPAGNAYYYPTTYVPEVEGTWWNRLLDATGMQLLVNNSYSGALMSGTAASSGLSRSSNLDDGTHLPDHIIVSMGVNDFKYPRNLGECGLNSVTYDVNNFSDAYYTALDNIRTAYPKAKLYLATIMEFNYPNDGVIGFPIKNTNGANLIEFNAAIRKLADIFGADVIEFTKCGVTYFNKSTTLGDSNLHPNGTGHYLMFAEALKHFK